MGCCYQTQSSAISHHHMLVSFGVAVAETILITDHMLSDETDCMVSNKIPVSLKLNKGVVGFGLSHFPTECWQ